MLSGLRDAATAKRLFRKALIDSRFSTIIYALVYSGLPLPVPDRSSLTRFAPYTYSTSSSGLPRQIKGSPVSVSIKPSSMGGVVLADQVAGIV